MDLRRFDDMPRESWDSLVHRFPESTYQHTSWWLDYQNAINGTQGSRSFILFERGEPVAICPLAVSIVNRYGQEFPEASFQGAPPAYPAIANLPPAQRRRTVRKVFDAIHRHLEPGQVKRAVFQRHPVSVRLLDGHAGCTNAAEAISAGYQCQVKNTIILDLGKDEEALSSEISKYHRKIIKHGRKAGLVIREYRGRAEGLDASFDDFLAAHIKSAGRLTRPMESWDAMRDLLRRDIATLFTASLPSGEAISFLYCAQFRTFSFGWSQVNIDEYEKEYSPRHLLEWEAMMAYKRRGAGFYELGIKYDTPQPDHVPTKKEVTISQFKERYGGNLHCSLFFERFFDRELARRAHGTRLEEFLSSPTAFSLQAPVDEREE